MKKYSKAGSELHSQFKQREPHPLEKYVGRHAAARGSVLEVVGYSHSILDGEPMLIVDASQVGGWPTLEPFDVVFKECKYYWYVDIDVLID